MEENIRDKNNIEQYIDENSISVNHKSKFIDKEKINRFQRFVLYFFIFAFMGWIMETIYALFYFGYFVKRGFLYGPICPIYRIWSININ